MGRPIGLAKRRSLGTNPAVGGFANGTVTAPSIFFASTPVLGLYRVSSTVLGFSRDTWSRWEDAAGNVIRIEPGNVGIRLDLVNSGSGGIELKLNADSTPRLALLTSGFTLGSGAGAQDAGFSRNAANILEINTGTVGAFADLKLRHLLAGHSVAPTIASGFGTGPSIAGSDMAGRVTVGTGGIATSGVITFGVAFATAPSVIAVNETTSIALRATATTTQVTLTSAAAFVAGDSLAWIAIGY